MTLVVAPTAPSAVLARDRVRPAEPGSVSTEVLVIGTGAGGAMAGTTLAQAGRKVLFLEAGGAYEMQDFRRRSLAWSTTHLYAQRGSQIATGTATMVVPSGRTVGGSTVLNSAICFRPPAHRLQEWATRAGAPWLLSPDFASCVDEVWSRIGVLPTHAGIGRTNNMLFQRGCERLGLRHAWMDRNAPGCVGCGVCHLGCPSGGKASVDRSLLPDALNHGAEIRTRARVEGLIVQGGRCVGADVVVVNEDDETPRGRLRVNADVVIVAGSAFGSPLVLQASGVGGPEVGRHLAVHPGIAVFGEFEKPVVVWDGVPQGYYAHCPDDDHALLETANAGPGEMFAVFGRVGDYDVVKRLAHLSMAGAMIRDSGNGEVSIDDGERPAQLRPKVKVRLNERDLQAFRAGAHTLVRAWFAAGARRVCPGIEPLRFFDRDVDAHAAIDALTSPSQLAQPYASHPQGTCRMGPVDGETRGVVDPTGRVHGVQGLYVMDGSIFPTTLGVNPQVTILAMARYLAGRLVGQFAPPT